MRLALSAFLGAALLGCGGGPTPGTHTGDPNEPPWVMNPAMAAARYPGRYIFAAGVSSKIGDKMVARRQAEANARQELGRRLSEWVGNILSQWTRDAKLPEETISTAEIKSMSGNISSEFLVNCEILEYWQSHKSGEYCALARIPFDQTHEKIRNAIMAQLAKTLADEKARQAFVQQFDQMFGTMSEKTDGDGKIKK